jgi:hypothetical protein
MAHSTGAQLKYSAYDAAGGLTESWQDTHRFTYTYNAAGLTETIGYPSGRNLTTCYDSAGRAQLVKDGSKTYAAVDDGPDPEASTVTLKGFAPNGAVQRLRMGTNLVEIRTLNTRQQTERIWSGVLTQSLSYAPLLKLSYGYGAAGANNGNVLSQSMTAGALSLTQSYGYDGLNRLVSAQEAGASPWTETSSYDKWGNRWAVRSAGLPPMPLTSASFADAGPTGAPTNRVSGENYDQAGHQTSHGFWTLTWDAEGRLAQGDGESGSGSWAYVYDAEGRRVKRFRRRSARRQRRHPPRHTCMMHREICRRNSGGWGC